MNKQEAGLMGVVAKRSGPNIMADEIRDKLDDLGAELEVCRDRLRRSEINKHRHALKGMLRWCKTRAGYVPGIGE